jgi:hypothetical protein
VPVCASPSKAYWVPVCTSSSKVSLCYDLCVVYTFLFNFNTHVDGESVKTVIKFPQNIANSELSLYNLSLLVNWELCTLCLFSHAVEQCVVAHCQLTKVLCKQNSLSLHQRNCIGRGEPWFPEAIPIQICKSIGVYVS